LLLLLVLLKPVDGVVEAKGEEGAVSVRIWPFCGDFSLFPTFSEWFSAVTKTFCSLCCCGKNVAKVYFWFCYRKAISSSRNKFL
jgi:hypothetical protein